MMMEPAYDQYDFMFGGCQNSSDATASLFPGEVTLDDFINDPSLISPESNTIGNPENEFDASAFEAIFNEIISYDPSIFNEQLSGTPPPVSPPIQQNEPSTREIGTDPMESVLPTKPITIWTADSCQFAKTPIIFIQTTNHPALANTIQFEPITLTTRTPSPPMTVPTSVCDVQIENSPSATNDGQIDYILPPSSSTSNESHEDMHDNSPDKVANNTYSSMLTDLDNLPSSGPLVLTNEELKLFQQEGYDIPKKLPLSKVEERTLKKVRRKIKNKISAQESRRKKKEYVEALEKQIAGYVDENKALKERMTAMEKSQKTLTKERDLLRSMLSKASPGTTGTALMAFAIFFAVVFGIWAPAISSSSTDDRTLSFENAFIPSNNFQSTFESKKSPFEQSDATPASYATDNYKSRVLLSVDDHDDHHNYGPFLPPKSKNQLLFQQQTAAPAYTYSHAVEKYMNKKHNSAMPIDEEHSGNFKRSFDNELMSTEEIVSKKRRSNTHIQDNFVIIEETKQEMDYTLNQSKPVKIIRVERTAPAITNGTLILNQRTLDK